MTLRDAVRPVYMPPWVRVAALLVGLVIIAPPLIHMCAHVWLILHGVPVVESGSDWPRLVQIVFGGGIMFPDPVIGMILAWRRRRAEQADTEEREARR